MVSSDQVYLCRYHAKLGDISVLIMVLDIMKLSSHEIVEGKFYDSLRFLFVVFLWME